MENLTENNKMKPTDILPKPLTICTSVDSPDQSQTSSKVLEHAYEEEIKLDTHGLNMHRKYNPNDNSKHETFKPYLVEHSKSPTSETKCVQIKKQTDKKVDLHLDVVNNQFKFIMEEQAKMKDQITSLTSKIDTLHLSQNLEPVISSALKNVIHQSHNTIEINPIIETRNTNSDIVRISHSEEIHNDYIQFTEMFMALLSPNMYTILNDIFNNTYLPKFKNICSSMYKNIDDAFINLTMHYRNEVCRKNPNIDIDFPFKQCHNNLCFIFENTEHELIRNQIHMEDQFPSILQDKLLLQIKSSIIGFENTVHQYAIISNLLKHGDAITAFKKALSTLDLQLVLYVCEKVSPEIIFQPPNSLDIGFILCLIQLLSVDLKFYTELKYEYLEAALGSLDHSNEEHKSNINFALVKMDLKIENFIQNYSNNYYNCKFKVLHLAIKMIITQNNK